MTIEQRIAEIIDILRTHTKDLFQPLVDQMIDEFGHDPYIMLISCLLSLRAKDITTIHVCRKLFQVARTPQAMLAIPRPKLEQLVFKTGYYKNKAKVLHEVSHVLLEQYNGEVPDTLEELLSIKGIGRKTANLVLGLAYHKPSICVDTHVHRISNRLGLIKTKTTDETEFALEKVLPKKFWIEWNKRLVMWGQNVCVPISPKCSTCPIKHLCKRVGVLKHR